jgi:hypothetical protein
MRLMSGLTLSALLVFSAAGSAPVGAMTRSGFPPSPNVGPGAVLTSAHQGQIFGFAIDRTGKHGILGDAGSGEGGNGPPAIETFDPATATIGKVVMTTTGDSDFLADGVFAGDVGLFTYEQVVGNGVQRSYPILDPIGHNRVTGNWNSPFNDFGIKQVAENTETTVGLIFGIKLQDSDLPALVASDVGQNSILNVIELDPNLFSLGNQPQVAQDPVNNRAVIATSPSFGAAGGAPPDIFLFDLASGKSTSIALPQCPGLTGCGYANGVGFDWKKQVVATTTEIYPGVHFYDLGRMRDTLVQLPGNAGQYNSATTVVNDPVHHLFLVAQPESSLGAGSNIFVYDVAGNLQETLGGFNFTFANDIVTPIQIALDAKGRSGYVDGPQVNQIQHFTY